MGCIASIAPPDLIVLQAYNYECLKQKIAEYNCFYEECKIHMKEIITIEEEIDKRLTVLLSECRSSGSIEFKFAESYIYIILFIVHASQNTDSDLKVMFTNYVPGIRVDENSLPDVLKSKYLNLKELAESLPRAFEIFKEMGNLIIADIIKARDEIPKEMYRIAKENPEISIVDFAKIERDWADNFDILGKIGTKLDTIFKNAKICLKTANKVIEECNRNFKDLQRIIDSIDSWNYNQVDRIKDGTYEFIKKYIGISN